MSLQLAAQHLANRGRGGDSVLVHMTPGEVRGLQELAKAHGGSLTINPETGLPEANFLKALLPTIIGAALAPLTAGTSLAFLGTPLGAGLAVGGFEALRTGDLGKGLMAGFGAYGGSNLAGALASAGTSAAVEGARASIPAIAEGDVARLMLETGADKDVVLKQLQREAIEKATTDAARSSLGGSFSDRAMAGLQSLKGEAGRSAFMDALGGTKGAFQTAAGIAGPISAAQDIQSRLPQTVTQSPVARITPYKVDKYGNIISAGSYTPEKFSEMGGFASLYGQPPGGAEGGLTPFAEGGMANTAEDAFSRGGMFDFAERSEPVVRMADGGITPNPNPFAQQIAEGQKAIPFAQGTAATAKDIADIYQSVLGRAPDEGGLAFYQASQFSPDQIRADIMKSPEAQAFMAGPKTHAQLGAQAVPYAQGVAATESDINQIYRDMLGRTPDEGGFQFYKASQFSPEQIRAEIAKSQEYLTRPFTPEVQTMDEVRSDYEAGGGGTQMRSVNTPEPGAQVMTQNKVVDTLQGYLAANPNATIAQIQAWGTANGIPAAQLAAAINERRFNQMTGGSLQAYDYLMGRGAYPIKPYVQGGGPIMRSYREVMGLPTSYEGVTPRFLTSDQQAVASGVPKEVPLVKDPSGNRYSDFVSFYFAANPDVQKAFETQVKDMTPEDYVQYHYSTYGSKAPENRKGYYEQLAAKPAEAATISGGKAGGLMEIAAAAARGGNVGQYDLGSYSDGGRLLRGPGDGVSDSIPATIGGKRPARLADGEFVVPARIVSELGNGSTEAGARKLYAMMDRVQAARKKSIGKGKVAKNSRADKYLPA